LRGGVESTRVHAVAEAAVSLDGPRSFISTAGTAENELTMPRQFQLGLDCRIVTVESQWDHGFTGGFARFGRLVVGRVHAHIRAAIRLHNHLHELAHHGVALVPLRPFAALLDHRFVLLGQNVG